VFNLIHTLLLVNVNVKQYALQQKFSEVSVCLCEEMGFLPSSKLSTSDVQKCKMRRQSAQCGNVVATRTDISETNVSTAGGGDIRGAMSISC